MGFHTSTSTERELVFDCNDSNRYMIIKHDYQSLARSIVLYRTRTSTVRPWLSYSSYALILEPYCVHVYYTFFVKYILFWLNHDKQIYSSSSSSSRVWAAIRSRSRCPFSEIRRPPLRPASRTPSFSRAWRARRLTDPEASLW